MIFKKVCIALLLGCFSITGLAGNDKDEPIDYGPIIKVKPQGDRAAGKDLQQKPQEQHALDRDIIRKRTSVKKKGPKDQK